MNCTDPRQDVPLGRYGIALTNLGMLNNINRGKSEVINRHQHGNWDIFMLAADGLKLIKGT